MSIRALNPDQKVKNNKIISCINTPNYNLCLLNCWRFSLAFSLRMNLWQPLYQKKNY